MNGGCRLCPRQCGADRTSSSPKSGEMAAVGGQRNASSFCGAPDELEVASVCIHRGEEPPLNPIVNIFFSHCNLQCIYCQNWQINQGGRSKVRGERYSIDELADTIVSHLSPLTSHLSPLIGFVTAAHYADRIPAIVEAVQSRLSALPDPLPAPTIVYNSGGYESVETLRNLEGVVDIYLPDFKYMDPQLAARYSHAPDYPEVATAAIGEMIRQVGIGLKVDSDGRAYRGIIVRHLVLPGAVENSLAVLNKLSTINFHLSPFTSLHLSLMAQYFPPKEGLPAPLDRTITAGEYAAVVARAEELGLTNGWIQELAAKDNYRPDFTKDNPFEK